MKKIATLLLAFGFFSRLWAQNDTIPPDLVCLNGLSVNLMFGTPPQVTLFASDFIQFASDNQTPTSLLQFGVRKAGQGTGFPVLSNGAPQESFTFYCDELGTNGVELWVRDTSGNTSFCETYVLLQDNLLACASSTQLCLDILTEEGNGVEGVSVSYLYGGIAVPGIVIQDETNAQGLSCGALILPALALQSITPSLDADHRNGITVHDVDLLRRHILGITPLSSPYKIMAADANRSGSVTTMDLLTLRRLALGIDVELPQNTSWRFIDNRFVFPNVSNPFATLVPEVIEWPVDSTSGFVGIKIGDIDADALANSNMSHPVLTDSVTVFFDDRAFVAGDTFQVGIRFSGEIGLKQMTLELQGLKVIGVLPGSLFLDDFGVFSDTALQYLTMMGYSPGDSFSIRLVAGQTGVMREHIRLSNAITRSFGLTPNYAWRALRLQSDTPVNTGEPAAQQLISSVSPNPCTDGAVLMFQAPAPATMRITVTDALGRVVLDRPYAVVAGNNHFELPAAQWHAGWFHYRIQTAAGVPVAGGVLIKN